MGAQHASPVAIFSPTCSDLRLKCSLRDRKYTRTHTHTHLSGEPVPFDPVTFQEGLGLICLISLRRKGLTVNTQMLSV